MKFNSFYFSILFTTSMLFSHFSFGQATFGAEFNFSNQVIRLSERDVINSDNNTKYQEMLFENIKGKCSDCQFEIIKESYQIESYKVIFPDNWYFIISTDPSVVEIQTKPSFFEEVKKQEVRMKKYIFESAVEVGLKPASDILGLNWAGGHIHIGLQSAFEGDIKLFRNFLVDFANHPELGSGILSYDYNNALPLAFLPQEQQNHFEQIIQDIDKGRLKTFGLISGYLRKKVYSFHYHNWTPPTKYHALNINRVGNFLFSEKEQTIEIRSLRAQQTAYEFVLLVQLFNSRLQYLKKINTPIKLQLKEGKDRVHQPQMAAESFFRYVEESGLDPMEYVNLFKNKTTNDFQSAFDDAYKKRHINKASCRFLFN